MAGEVNWVPGQKGTPLLQDENMYLYRINKANKENTLKYYRCVKRAALKCPAVAVLSVNTSRLLRIVNNHSHQTDALVMTARTEEKRMIAAAATVGNVGTRQVLSQIKTNLERSDLPESTVVMRKTHALNQAVRRERQKILGINSVVPKTSADIIAKLPDRYKVTATGGPFLRHMEIISGDKLMMLYLSDHGKLVIERANEVYCDGTFDSAPHGFMQIYFILAKQPNQTAVPVAFALLPNKDTITYKAMWTELLKIVDLNNGVLKRIVTDFEKAVMTAAKEALPNVEITGCHFHHKQAIRRKIQVNLFNTLPSLT